jgi:DNA-binding transcriptional regulator YdaS (Cro superfamily)
MNDLASYLEAKRIKRSHFARQIGVTPARITQICNGEAPSLKTAAAIEAATKGAVRAIKLVAPEAAR